MHISDKATAIRRSAKTPVSIRSGNGQRNRRIAQAVSDEKTTNFGRYGTEENKIDECFLSLKASMIIFVYCILYNAPVECPLGLCCNLVPIG